MASISTTKKQSYTLPSIKTGNTGRISLPSTSRTTTAPKTSITLTRPSSATKQTESQKAYVSRLGFTPKELPEFRSDVKKEKSGLRLFDRIFDLLGRGEAGLTGAFSEEIKRVRPEILAAREQSAPGKAFTAGKLLVRATNPLFYFLPTKSEIKDKGFLKAGLEASPIGQLTSKSGYLYGLKEGLLGNTRYSGSTLYSQVIDDPELGLAGKTAQELSPGFKKAGDVAGSFVGRLAGGLATGLALDPFNQAPVGKVAETLKEPAKGAGKLAGLSDEAIDIGRQLEKIPAVRKLRNTFTRFGGNKEANIALDEINKSRGFGEEVGQGLQKLLNNDLSEKEVEPLVDNVVGFIRRSQLDEVKKAELIESIPEQIRLAQKAATTIKETAEKVDQAQLFKQLTGVIKKGDAAYDDALEAVAAPVRSLIDDAITPQLVQRGILDESTAARGVGEYLGQLYNKLNVDTADQTIGLVREGSKIIGEEGNRLLRRSTDAERVIEAIDEGLVQVAPEARGALDEARKVVSDTVATIRNSNTEDEIFANRQALDEAAKILEGVVGGGQAFKEIALQQKIARGMITDASIVAPATVIQLNDLLQKYTFLDWADNVFGISPSELGNVSEDALKNLKKIPANKSFGNLAGKYVPDYAYNDIVGIYNPPKGIVERFTNLWKQLKLFTPFNTATNARNGISNMVLNTFVEDGVPIWRQDIYAKAMLDIQKGGKYSKAAREAGLFVDTFAARELGQDLARATGKTSTALDAVENSKILNKAFEGFNIGPVGSGRKAFEFTENTGKLAQFIYQTEDLGKSADEAVRIAEKALFNYSQLPTALNKARSSIMPFVSFKYFATRLAVDTFWNRTGKLTRYLKAAQSWNDAAFATQEGARAEDVPSYLQDQEDLILRIPWQDSNGNAVLLDSTYLFPFGDITGGFAPEDLLGPFAKQAVEQSTNRNFYLNKPIVSAGDANPLATRLQYAFESLGPKSPAVPGSREQQKIINAVSGKLDKQGRKIAVAPALLDVFGGIKLREGDAETNIKIDNAIKDSEIRQIQAEINKIQKDQSISQRSKEKQIQSRRDKIKEIRESKSQL